MNIADQWRQVAKRFRDATSRGQYDSACQRAGQLAFQAIDAGALDNPLRDYPRPERMPGDTDAGPRYQLAWWAFVSVWTVEHDDRIPPNPFGIKYETISDGVKAGQSGEWQVQAANCADVAEWLADRCDTKQQGEALPAIDKEGFAALMVLFNRDPLLCTLDDLSMTLARGTAGKAIQKLIEAGYAHRPNGDRGGAGITERGRAVVAKAKSSAN